jgi:colanic acid biosynthesis glycosyl transferase WcaI
MSRVVLVEQYFYPDGWGGAEIPRDLAVTMQAAGFEVAVVCGTEQYAPAPPGDQTPDPRARGVKIVRVPRVLPGPVRRWRTLRVLWFCLWAAPVLLLRRQAALIMTQTNPPLIVPTVALVAKLRRVPFVIIAQDIYPEVLFASGVTAPGSLPGRALGRLFAWAYRRAQRVVVLGSFMRERVLRKGVSAGRITTISNWATGELSCQQGAGNPLRSSWRLQGRFVVLYSGNMGVGHEFETFVRGVSRAAATHGELAVTFVGAGSRLGEVRALARQHGIEDRVTFHDFVPAEELPLTMGVADLALVTLRDGFEGVLVPSKLYGYMARGIPSLYVGPRSDISEVIERADCGASCLPGDAAGVARVLCGAMESSEQLRLWAANARGFYQQHLSREVAVRRYVDLASEVVGGAR